MSNKFNLQDEIDRMKAYEAKTSIPLPPLAWPYTGLATNIKEMIRARDQEIVRCVLEAAADFCTDEYHTGNGWGTTTADRRCAAGIRALEFKHAE